MSRTPGADAVWGVVGTSAHSGGNGQHPDDDRLELDDPYAGLPYIVADDDEPRMPLEFLQLKELRRQVADRGPRRYLLRGAWPAGSYGVHAAEMKAQKSWNAVDLAVSVASGTPWLGHVPVDDPGPVLLFWGEGEDAGLVRRIDAVCDSRGLDPDTLDIVVCCRAPHLGNAGHLVLFAQQVRALRPKLVELDPLYLSTGGANAAALAEMGALLEKAQHICAEVGAALFVVTHFNRRRDGASGALRITGAGPAEWGRVLITADVVSRHTDLTTKETVVITALDVIGGEVPGSTWRVTRRIRADDPDDLNSPLRYAVTVTVTETGETAETASEMPPAKAKLLEALRSADGPQTAAALVDWIAEKHGHGLKRPTVSTYLNQLLRDGLADCIEVPGSANLWALAGVSAVSDDTPLTPADTGVSAVSAPSVGADTLTLTPTPMLTPPGDVGAA